MAISEFGLAYEGDVSPFSMKTFPKSMIVDLVFKRLCNKIQTNKNDYDMIKLSLIGFFESRRGGIPPTTIGAFRALDFTAYGGKIQAARYAGGR